jgi:hypothetical protein
MNPKLVISGLLITTCCLGAAAQLTTVNWGAQISSGLGDTAGNELAIGDLLRVGTFNLTDTQIQANSSNLQFLNQSFVAFAQAFVGDDVGVPAHWNSVSTASTDALGLSGRRIYLWAFDAPSMNSATQQGIFTSANSSWIFPLDEAIPNTTSIDLQEVGLSGIVVGSYGIGNSSTTGAQLFNLALVPEPAGCWTLFAIICLSGFAARIRNAD